MYVGGGHAQEIKSHPLEGHYNPINAHQILTTEVPNDVLTIYNQHALHQDDMDPLFHREGWYTPNLVSPGKRMAAKL